MFQQSLVAAASAKNNACLCSVASSLSTPSQKEREDHSTGQWVWTWYSWSTIQADTTQLPRWWQHYFKTCWVHIVKHKWCYLSFRWFDGHFKTTSKDYTCPQLGREQLEVMPQGETQTKVLQLRYKKATLTDSVFILKLSGIFITQSDM